MRRKVMREYVFQKRPLLCLIVESEQYVSGFKLDNVLYLTTCMDHTNFL